jgi:hypothetical protein
VIPRGSIGASKDMRNRVTTNRPNDLLLLIPTRFNAVDCILNPTLRMLCVLGYKKIFILKTVLVFRTEG